MGHTSNSRGGHRPPIRSFIVRWLIYLTATRGYQRPPDRTPDHCGRGHRAYIPNIIALIPILVIGIILVDWLLDFLESMGKTRRIEGFGVVTILLRAFFYFVVVILALQQLLLDLSIIYVFVVPLAWGLALGLGAAIAIIVGFGLRDRAPEIMDRLMKKAEEELFGLGGGGPTTPHTSYVLPGPAVRDLHHRRHRTGAGPSPPGRPLCRCRRGYAAPGEFSTVCGAGDLIRESFGVVPPIERSCGQAWTHLMHRVQRSSSCRGREGGGGEMSRTAPLAMLRR